MLKKLFRYNLKLFKLDIVFALCAIAVLIIDQITKNMIIERVEINAQIELIPNFLYITHIKNTGAAFGMFQNSVSILIVISFIAIILVAILKATLRIYSFTYNTALGFILGGATGNLFDRIFLREVTDFIQVNYFAVFNGADSFLVIGFILLFIIILKVFFKKEEKSLNKD
ncbi:MAG: signal peptidase II [Actinomycetota bacterium]|nr:signal peptidase II [Actinomycetota bacterium]